MCYTGNIYNIVCVADEAYAQHAAVMLVSLFVNNRRNKFRIFLLSDGLSSLTKERLDILCKKFNNHIIFIESSFDVIRHYNVGQWNFIMYAKLLTPHFLPVDIKRYLFLDVDLVVNAEIEELYNFELEGAIIAACEDIPDCVVHKKRLGLSSEQLYINSGVMLVDLEKWRAKDFSCEELMKSSNLSFINDQDIISLYFKNEIVTLPIKWNMVTFYYMRNPKIFSKYKDTLAVNRKYPCIVHFACPIKPWFRDCRHPFAYLYKRYLRMTPWNNYYYPYYEQLTKWGRIKKTIRYYMNRINFIKDDLFLVR